MRFFPLLFMGVCLLAGCGGGGGGGGSAVQPPGSSASNDQASVDEESSVTIDVLANDSEVDANTLSLTASPANGGAEISGSQIVYTPDVDFFGTDSFRYGVTGNDGTQLSATVNITVNDINDVPVAVDDSFTIIEDNVLALALGGNDTDVDDGIASFEVSGSFQGTVSGTGTSLSYTPPLDFVGEVSFQYRAVDSRDGVSNVASVTIDVVPVTVTMMETASLMIPQSGYAAGNDGELGAAVLRSADIEFEIPPNAVSLLLSLTGRDANIDEGGLFISNVSSPSGLFTSYQRFIHFCFSGNCTALIPRLPAYAAESGTWTYQLGTLADSVAGIDFSGLSLTAAFRSGPTPVVAEAQTATFTVSPFLTADTVDVDEISGVMAKLAEIAASHQIVLEIDPVTVIADAQFDRVSASFIDSNTAALVQQGRADAINLFFVEDFTDEENLAGISAGIPGSLGVSNGHNGVLVDADAALGVDLDFYFEETAETAFHEMAHLLGLYHTTEARFSFNDVLDDTPNCDPAIHDVDGDGVADAPECPDASNPMFWFRSILIEQGPLTDDQKHVLFFSPLAVPGS